VPLTTPEARAGLRQRLVEHSRNIGHSDLARMYRDQWLERFDRDIAPQRRAFTPGPRGTFQKGRFSPPEPPMGDIARAISASGIDAPTARALILGFTYFPEELAAHGEALAALPIPDKGTARLRDELVNAAFSGAALDRDSIATILAGDSATGPGPGITAPGSTRAMGFSFTRRDSDPARARSDLAAAVEIIAASEEVERALVDATERLKRDLTDEALAEQHRLIAAQQGLRERLASLAGTD